MPRRERPPTHIPTPETLAKVRASAALDTPPGDIATLLGITKGQLLRHYAREFNAARVQAGQAIKANLYHQAAKGTGRNAVAAARAWFEGVGNVAPGLISVTHFAEHIGVSRQIIYREIRRGRISVYDATGRRIVAPMTGQNRFVKLQEALSGWEQNRVQMPRGAVVDDSLLARRMAREGLQGELLKLRLAKERGELVSYAETLAAFESAGRTIARAIQTLPSWAEELCAVARHGDVAATTRWLRVKVAELCNSIADSVAAEAN